MVIMDDTMELVKQVLLAQFDIETADIKPTSNIAEDFNGSSLDAIEFIMALEVEFEIDIPDEEVEKFKTVQNIVDYVSKNIK
ncbi:Acyl carrier protein [Pseudomonas amygdali pv. lachrymans]|nr:Acyl carrier protein [Pseudomonas amygdali pv. lachrymans]